MDDDATSKEAKLIPARLDLFQRPCVHSPLRSISIPARPILRPIAQPLSWPPPTAKLAPFLAAIDTFGRSSPV